uniref:Uncharacterized protein n=1 Tax=Arundo donax TaxID=35708 RepID=A0A0A8Z2G1_ARUDO
MLSAEIFCLLEGSLIRFTARMLCCGLQC